MSSKDMPEKRRERIDVDDELEDEVPGNRRRVDRDERSEYEEWRKERGERGRKRRGHRERGHHRRDDEEF